MALYRNIAGFNQSFELPDTEGFGDYVVDYYDPLPPLVAFDPPTLPTPQVFYDPVYVPPAIENTGTYTPEVTLTQTGATSPVFDPTLFEKDGLPSVFDMLPKGGTTFTPIDTNTLPSIPLPQTPVPTTTPTTLPPITTQTPVIPLDTGTALKNNWLPLATLAGLMVVAVTGDKLLKKKRKFVFIGGLGLLYYGMAKNQTT